MRDNPIKYIIVDFSASLIHTHHKQSLFAFSSLLEKRDIENEIWVPIGSQINNSEYKLRKILIPGTHSAAFNFLKPQTWIPGSLGKLLFVATKYNLDILLKLYFYLLVKCFCKLISSESKSYSLKIIFTTACPFSFKSILALEKNMLKLKIYCRLTNTSENRGTLAQWCSLNDFFSQMNNFKYISIRFGVETKAYLKVVDPHESGIFYMSKFPHISKKNSDLYKNTNFTLSFLGFPTIFKGQKHISNIVKTVSKKRPDSHFQIQVYENDPIISDLNNFNHTIKFIIGKVRSEEIEDALRNTTLICLPYDKVAFKYNSSAMMYEALDYHIPIITFAGSAFSSDVEIYNCGLVVNDEIEMINAIVNITDSQIKEWKVGCQSFNEFRNTSNYEFLEI